MRSQSLLLTFLSASLATSSSSPFYTEHQYPFIDDDATDDTTAAATAGTGPVVSSAFQCDLPPPVAPSDGLPSARDLFTSEAAIRKQVERHAALVRVPSICYDDLGDFDKDERWNVFYELHDVLKKTYPVL
ncbi:peptidase family M20/M25/M40 [Colletotrichum orchidophilum]|uniref:Peptidase family M20/M25/M40 n=1 Tax=Colletotrichum orchidophilum TaxID=1209926 RepID=A0A1G4B4F3_9PEZI|nr:peptidase family M20/M25/M40 [Colletotrichum orchidophilum]OHE96277.1 peptidase family M20/M25/M40 [Colletotrichum orchidophilum]